MLRLELTGYPQTAPTGGLWDLDTNASLAHDRRPKGERVAQLFRTDGWVGAATAMYAAWDRIGLESHPGWANSNPLQAWKPTCDLSFVLEQVHEELNADDYRACRGPHALLRIRRTHWRAMLAELKSRGSGRRESGAFLLSDRGG